MIKVLLNYTYIFMNKSKILILIYDIYRYISKKIARFLNI